MNTTSPATASDAPSADTRKAYLPAVTAIALFLLTVILMIRGGVSADMTGVSPSQFNEAHQLIFARYIGVLDITLGSAASLGAMAAGAVGIGLVLRKLFAPRIDMLTLATTGLGILWLLFEGLSLAGAANTLVAWGLCVTALIAGLVCHAAAVQKAIGQSQSIMLAPYLKWRWSSVLIAPPCGLLLVAACCPPGTLWSVEAFGYDVLSYHLQIPREWLAVGQITGLEHNVYSYLPSLVEVAFLQLGAMRGSVYQAAYTCQLLNVGLCALAAMHLAKLVTALTHGQKYSAVAGCFTAAIFLATPWVLVTGSMAYDEAAVLAFGACALSLSLSPTLTDTSTPTSTSTWRVALLVGVLVGLATQAKLTSGFMIAVPVGLIWLLRLTPWQHLTSRDASTPSRVTELGKCIGLMTLAGVLILLPYVVRNAAWTGNPVFPFATNTLGQGHWHHELTDRWNRGHHVDESVSQRVTALGQQWLFNTGYGSIAGRSRSIDPSKPEARNVAYFPKQWGFPTLLLAALAGWLVLIMLPQHRRLAIALGVILLVQILAWLFLTHLQSRFMIFSLLPVCIAAGAGLAVAGHRWLHSVHVAVHGLSVLMAGVLVMTSVGLLRQQVIGQLPLWQVVDGLPSQQQSLDPKFDSAIVGDHPINKLSAWSKTLLIADNSRLFYIQRPMVYHSAFDASMLGDLIRQHPSDPAAVTRELKAQGITHVWLHGPELGRLMTTYGFDAAITPESLTALIQTGWRVVPFAGQQNSRGNEPLVAKVVLYALP